MPGIMVVYQRYTQCIMIMPTLEICLVALTPESPKKSPIIMALTMCMASFRYVRVWKEERERERR